MIDALHIAQSGLKATQDWLDIISNNITNSQTAAYKKSSVQFVEMVKGSEATTQASGTAESGGMGTRLADPNLIFSSGVLSPTDQTLDLAINGKGFFEVILDDGEPAYTRVGRLSVSEDGTLVTNSGYALSSNIQIPPDVSEISIDSKGYVFGKVGELGSVELGQIHLAHITNPAALNSLGNGLFRLTENSGDVALREPGSEGVGTIQQGYLEMSNVELIEEMTSLVLAQRAYQLNARLVQVMDQTMETINNLRRG